MFCQVNNELSVNEIIVDLQIQVEPFKKQRKYIEIQIKIKNAISSL